MGSNLFPEELEIEVLLRLPVRSLFRFKCVSKKWLSIIESAHFIKRHTKFSKTRHSGKLLCFRKDPVIKAHIISIIDDQTMEKLEDLEWPPFLNEGVEGEEHCSRAINILGPVNGIYCIFRSLINRWVGTLVLWNPATRDYKHIRPHVAFPFPDQLLSWKLKSNWNFDLYEPIRLHVGFGFDHTNNDYKVVVICDWSRADDGEDNRWHVRVYSLSSDSWRTIYFLNEFEHVIPAFKGLHPPFPVMDSFPEITHCFLNGVCHWSCTAILNGRYDSLEYFHGIVTFEMTSETFRLMRLPTSLDANHRSVWVFRDTIAMVLFGRMSDLEVWVMTEYGVDESWTKMYTFGEVIDWSPLGFSNDGRIFFDDQNGQLISYGFEDDDQIKEHDIYGMKIQGLCGIGDVNPTLGISNYVETLETFRLIDHH